MPKELICDLMKIALADKYSSDYITFPVHNRCIKRVNQHVGLSLEGYSCYIHCNDIRHVYNRHPEAHHYLCYIPDILKNFDSIEKEVVPERRTGGSQVVYKFYKKYNRNLVKLVKLRVHKDKTINLKTLFVMDEVVQ
ncbi:hypothetical protein [Sulfurimonas sp.]|uniref:PBECR3 domain-containing polyvalent protein n=1 Tax=Sulfurimonas sp. TaxID=2022749 RepID=UPI0035653EAA